MEQDSGLCFPPSAWALYPGCLKGLWFLKSKSHTRFRHQTWLGYCTVWGGSVGMCHINAGSGINTGFWQCVLHLDWKKPLVNVITVFHFIIRLGFLNGRNVLFKNETEETRYANTLCCNMMPVWSRLPLRNNCHLSLLARQIKDRECVCL